MTLQPGKSGHSRTIRLDRLSIAAEKLAFFRYGDVAGKKLLTNDAGEWLFLEHDEFADFVAGRVTAGHPRYELLRERGFLREGFDVDGFAEKMRRKKKFVGRGPHLHIVITTLRCNQSCRYCHASRANMDRVDTDMSIETAKQVVDLAMQSSSQYINFEFQGGEPTINMPAIKFIVEYAHERNKDAGKVLDFSLVSNFTWMTEENAEWLLDNGVLVCTSLDGPEEVHNYNRLWKSDTNAFASVMKWMTYFNEGYVKRGRDPRLWHVDALMTTTRKSLSHYKEIVDLYVSLGIHTVHIRPLNPYGFANATWEKIGYSMDEYLDFYAKVLDYILELNDQGVEVVEGTATSFLTKMLTPDDPNFVDVRSPCGAGTGQVAYNYDGKIFTCDEGRMVSAEGNDVFQIGVTATSGYRDMLEHPTVRALAVASLQDALPGCNTCWNKPFCGVCPLHNYQSSGDIFGQRPNSPKCKEHYTIATLLFEKLADDPDGKFEKTLRKWTLTRPRESSSSCKV